MSTHYESEGVTLLHDDCLVTPPGGTVLEPFAGSGTTLEAAVREGFDVIGIEREAEYLPLILKRLQKHHPQSLFSDWDGAA